MYILKSTGFGNTPGLNMTHSSRKHGLLGRLFKMVSVHMFYAGLRSGRSVLRTSVNTRRCGEGRCARVCASDAHLLGNLASFIRLPLCPLPQREEKKVSRGIFRNSFQSGIIPYWKFIRKIAVPRSACEYRRCGTNSYAYECVTAVGTNPFLTRVKRGGERETDEKEPFSPHCPCLFKPW